MNSLPRPRAALNGEISLSLCDERCVLKEESKKEIPGNYCKKNEYQLISINLMKGNYFGNFVIPIHVFPTNENSGKVGTLIFDSYLNDDSGIKYY